MVQLKQFNIQPSKEGKMKALWKLLLVSLLVLGGCAHEPHLRSGFDSDAILKYGYPQREEWARARGERKPIEAAPVCFSREFHPLVTWATELGGKCASSGNSCTCASSRGTIQYGEIRPLNGVFRGDGGFTRRIANGFVKDGASACKSANAERRELRLTVDSYNGWGYEFEVQFVCSFP
jgi:hypothetical protein